MFKALLKKQLLEMNLWLTQDKKTGKRLSKAGILIRTALYIFVFGMVAGMFAFLAYMICEPFLMMNISWLYFTLMGLFSIVFGVIGSVFNTFASLYNAKDNELLLAMPIPPSKILFVRLFGVWFWSFIYSALVFIPAIVIYIIFGKPSTLLIICSVFILIAISVFVLSLSCILGWVVAKISSKLKNKSFISVILSLTFLAGYYFIYFRANELISMLLQNALMFGDAIKDSAYPLYLFGLACTGDILWTLVYFGAVSAIFAIIYYVLSKTFVKIATTNVGSAKKKYKKGSSVQKSAFSALVRKELRRFTSSPTYMLNCGLGVILIPALAVFAIFNAEKLRLIALGLFSITGVEDLTVLIAIAVLCFVASMVDISAPSISLEGKNIWILHTLPVSAFDALKAKLVLHLIFAEIPTLIASTVFIIILQPSIIGGIFMTVIPALFALMLGLFGLFVNILSPSLVWTNEIVPIKQGLPVFLALFVPWIFVAALAGLYYLLMSFISAHVFMLIALAVISVLSALMYLFLKNKGAKIFENL